MDFSWLVHNYLTRGFWGDEAWTAGISRLPLASIVKVTSLDFHPPFYYFLVHFLGGLFDYREVPVRLISTFFFLLIPLVVYLLTRLFWPNKKDQAHLYGLAAAILVLLSPILLTYAFEARSYALLAFESILSAYIFWQAKNERSGRYDWRISYFLVGSAMVYTHYYAWFVLLSHAVYLLLFERQNIKRMLAPATGIFLVQLPWLPTLLSQTGSVKESYWIGAINRDTHKEFFYRLTGGDLTTPFQKPLGLVIGYTALLGTAWALLTRRLSAPLRFLLCWLIVPTLVPTIISLTFAPIFFYRYLIFSAIPLLILTVQAVRHVFNHRLALLIALLIVAYLEIRVDWLIFTNYPPSMRDAVNTLYQTKKPGDGPVYTVLPAFAESLYYLNGRDPLIVEPVGLVQFSGKSLLDEYVNLGIVKISTPPTSSPYWYLSPERTAALVTPK